MSQLRGLECLATVVRHTDRDVRCAAIKVRLAAARRRGRYMLHTCLHAQWSANCGAMCRRDEARTRWQRSKCGATCCTGSGLALLARYYEAQGDLVAEGRHYAPCGQHHCGLKLLLQCGEAEVAAAIDVVGHARNNMLTHTLSEYLMGETDGAPKYPNHIYRLYLVLGKYQQAAKTAIVIARQQQARAHAICCNDRAAPAILSEAIRRLDDQRARVLQALWRLFLLLHSNTLAKRLAWRAVLTSCVIECQHAGLRKSAFEYASVLMRPEHLGLKLGLALGLGLRLRLRCGVREWRRKLMLLGPQAYLNHRYDGYY
ncbi:hypothetical protein JKP88DRAFT_246715 [Tribonema minus]|uniref:Uncharacterized protein n=1 Tax=Tribonema minus TaxID=303371 RepID=A0A835YW57_9STRA|nr:hypothetical protein JKP88DRAFT_246715 [Tribonema minus]